MHQQQSRQKLLARRGLLRDRHGRVLAASRLAPRLFADPLLIQNRGTFDERVAYNLGYDPLAISSFRPEREVRNWMQRDPVDICRATLIDWGVLDSERAAQIEEDIRAEVDEAFAWAMEQPLCTPEDGLKNVFATGEVPARQFG